jgi:hypothetical protein
MNGNRYTVNGLAYGLMLLAIATSGCKQKKDKKKEINLWVKPTVRSIDSSIQAFYTNVYYLPNIIRLSNDMRYAFAMVDSVPGVSNSTRLTQTNREQHYAHALPSIMPQDIEAYRFAWQLPEMQKMQHGDGGYGTLFTSIGSRPSKDTPLYVIEVRKNNIQEFPVNDSIGYIKYNTQTHEVWIADNSGYFIPLKSFRAANK